MLNYSREGLAARPAFFAPYNDITIIVEDVGKENFYTQVMRRLLGNNLTIGQVLGVGGKHEVVQRCSQRAHLQQQEFYLVDGDFDELLGLQCPNNMYFYRLRRYDIESYLLEEAAICSVAEEESPRRNANEYRTLLQVNPWITDIVNVSLRLAACTALLRELRQKRVETPQSIGRYVNHDMALPDTSRIDLHIQQISACQTVVDQQDFNRLLDEMLDRMGSSHLERIRWISGKDILIPLLIRLLRLHTRSSLRKESLCFRLARNCEFQELAELRDRILSIV